MVLQAEEQENMPAVTKDEMEEAKVAVDADQPSPDAKQTYTCFHQTPKESLSNRRMISEMGRFKDVTRNVVRSQVVASSVAEADYKNSSMWLNRVDIGMDVKMFANEKEFYDCD